MSEAFFPDYAGGSIANLMRTLADACGAASPLQPPLAARYGIDAAELREARNLVLFVVDGLGADLFAECAPAHLRAALRGVLTSVLPSTTASAIPLFMTGLAPAQHALTGWHMWFEEIAATLAVLPLKRRGGAEQPELPPFAELLPALFDQPPLYAQIDRPAWVLSPREIAFTPFNSWHTRGATTLPYANLGEMLGSLAGLLRSPGKKFIYAYWPSLDSVAHRSGAGSPEVRATLARFGEALGAFAAAARGSATRLIVTADHGFISSPPERVIDLAQHPRLAELLARPLCGEQRLAWCYLRPGVSADEFVARAESELGGAALALASRELLAAERFGPGPAHPKLAARIGDVALLMRDNWTLKDWLPDEPRYQMLGQHGGVSAAEMQVPLLDLAL